MSVGLLLLRCDESLMIPMGQWVSVVTVQREREREKMKIKRECEIMKYVKKERKAAQTF